MMDGRILEQTRRTNQRLIDAFGLEPIELESGLAHRAGTFKERDVTIRSSAASGPRIRLARFSVVTGETLEIGNVLCMPDPAYVAPILGADFVAVREDSVMLAADLSPVSRNPADHVGQFRTLDEALAGAPELPPGGDLPDWAVELFSEGPLYTRVHPDQLDDAFEVFDRYVDAFIRMVQRAAPDHERSAEFSRAQGYYSDVHRADDKGLRLLGAMFGMDWAKRYLEEFLFPPESSLSLRSPDNHTR